MRILTEEQQKWCDIIRDFAQKELEPVMYDYDKVIDPSKAMPLDVYQKGFALGLNAIEIPKEYGGCQVDLATAAVIYEEMGYYDGNFCSVVNTTNLALKPILIGGTPEQVQYFADFILKQGYAAFALTEPTSGSDASRVKTTAVYDEKTDEYVINGEKCFITNGGEASIMCVIASTDMSKGAKGLTAFMVPTATPGYSILKYEDKSGFRTLSTCSIKFDNVRIPAWNRVGAEGEGFKIAMKTIDKSRPCVGAIAVGMARRALDEAIKFTKERVTFGEPVANRQGIQWMIAEMDMKIESARLMIQHANMLLESGQPYGKEAAMAKLMATEYGFSVANDAVQLMGGQGYMKDGPVEKIWRDIKAYCIFEGTTQIQKIVISGALLSDKKKK